MNLATTAKLPKKTSARVNDPENPAWTEDMLGAPVIKRGRGLQATPTKVLTSVRLDADILEFSKSQVRALRCPAAKQVMSAYGEELMCAHLAKANRGALANVQRQGKCEGVK